MFESLNILRLVFLWFSLVVCFNGYCMLLMFDVVENDGYVICLICGVKFRVFGVEDFVFNLGGVCLICGGLG